jgi:hypothetical protein
VDKPSGAVGLQSDLTFGAGGTLTHNQGTLDLGIFTLTANVPVTVNGGDIIASNGDFNVGSTFNMTGGNVNDINFSGGSATLTVSGGALDNVTFNHASGTVKTLAGNGWNIGGTLTVSPLGATSRVDGTNIINLAGNFVQTEGNFGNPGLGLTFNGLGLQTITKTGGNFRTLTTVDKPSGAVGLQSDLTFGAGGSLTITSGDVFSLNGFNFGMGGNSFSNEGVFELRGSETVTLTQDIDSGTWRYIGNGDGNVDFYPIKDFGATDYFSLTFEAVDGVDVFLSPLNLTVAGDLSKLGGDFGANNGTVTLSGPDQVLHGDMNFHNLTKDTPGGTLTFEAGKTQTITGTLTLLGAEGNPLSLRSSSDGVRWRIDPQGTRNISYVDVKDSHNINPTPINLVGTGSVNSGNNLGYQFVSGFFWTGESSISWSDLLNWSGNALPGAADDVIINPATYQPVLDMDVAIDDLTLNSGSSLYLNGFSLAANTVLVDGATVDTGTGGLIDLTGSATVQTGSLINLNNGSSMTLGGSLIQTGGSVEVKDGSSLSGPLIELSGGTLKADGSLISVGGGGLTLGSGGPLLEAANGAEVRVSGDLIQITGSTLNVSSGSQLRVEKNITSSGTFNVDLLKIEGGIDSLIDLGNDHSIQDVIVDKSTTAKLTMQSDLDIGSKLDVLGGTFDANDRNITVTGLTTISEADYKTGSDAATSLHQFKGGLYIPGSGLVIGVSATGETTTVVTSGDIVVNGELKTTGDVTISGGTATGTGSITLSGFGDQSVIFNPVGGVSADVKVDKTGGTVTQGGGGWDLNKDLIVSGGSVVMLGAGNKVGGAVILSLGTIDISPTGVLETTDLTASAGEIKNDGEIKVKGDTTLTATPTLSGLGDLILNSIAPTTPQSINVSQALPWKLTLDPASKAMLAAPLSGVKAVELKLGATWDSGGFKTTIEEDLNLNTDSLMDAATAEVEVKGNVTNTDGQLNADIFSFTGDNLIIADFGNHTIRKVDVNKTPGSALSLTAPLTTSEAITVKAGKLNTNGQSVATPTTTITTGGQIDITNTSAWTTQLVDIGKGILKVEDTSSLETTDLIQQDAEAETHIDGEATATGSVTVTGGIIDVTSTGVVEANEFNQSGGGTLTVSGSVDTQNLNQSGGTTTVTTGGKVNVRGTTAILPGAPKIILLNNGSLMTTTHLTQNDGTITVDGQLKTTENTTVTGGTVDIAPTGIFETTDLTASAGEIKNDGEIKVKGDTTLTATPTLSGLGDLILNSIAPTTPQSINVSQALPWKLTLDPASKAMLAAPLSGVKAVELKLGATWDSGGFKTTIEEDLNLNTDSLMDAATAEVEVKGNVTNTDGQLNADIFSFTGDNLIIADFGNHTIRKVDVNKTPGSALSLTAPLTTSEAITVKAGKLNTNGQSVATPTTTITTGGQIDITNTSAWTTQLVDIGKGVLKVEDASSLETTDLIQQDAEAETHIDGEATATGSVTVTGGIVDIAPTGIFETTDLTASAGEIKNDGEIKAGGNVTLTGASPLGGLGSLTLNGSTPQTFNTTLTVPWNLTVGSGSAVTLAAPLPEVKKLELQLGATWDSSGHKLGIGSGGYLGQPGSVAVTSESEIKGTFDLKLGAEWRMTGGSLTIEGTSDIEGKLVSDGTVRFEDDVQIKHDADLEFNVGATWELGKSTGGANIDFTDERITDTTIIPSVKFGFSPDVIRLLSDLKVGTAVVSAGDTLMLNGFGLETVEDLTIDGTLDGSAAGASLIVGRHLALNSTGTMIAPSLTIVQGDLNLAAGNFVHNGGMVALAGAGTSTVYSPSTGFYDLAVETPGKTVHFTAGSTTTIHHSFMAQGDPGNLVTLDSATPGTAWNLDVKPGASAGVDFASIADMNSIGEPVAATHSVDGGGNTGNVEFISDVYIWLGLYSADFVNPANWDSGLVPDSSTSITVNAAPFDLMLDQDRTLMDVIVSPLGVFKLNGYDLTIRDLTVAGVLDASMGASQIVAGGDVTMALGGVLHAGQSELVFRGTDAQTFDPGEDVVFYDVTHDSAGLVTLEASLQAGNKLEVSGGGTFDATGVADIETKDLKISNGSTLKAPDLMTIDRDFEVDMASYFAHNNGFIDLEGVDGAIKIEGKELHDLAFSHSGKKTVASSFKVRGDLIVASGEVATDTVSRTIELEGDYTQLSSQSVFGDGILNLRLNGAGDQMISQTYHDKMGTFLANMLVDKMSGKLVLGTDFVVGGFQFGMDYVPGTSQKAFDKLEAKFNKFTEKFEKNLNKLLDRRPWKIEKRMDKFTAKIDKLFNKFVDKNFVYESQLPGYDVLGSFQILQLADGFLFNGNVLVDLETGMVYGVSC